MVMKASEAKVMHNVLWVIIWCIFLPIASSPVEGRPASRRLAAECKCAQAFVLLCTIQLICARSELIFLRLVFPQYHSAAWWDSLAWICQKPHWEQPVNDKKKREGILTFKTPKTPSPPPFFPVTSRTHQQPRHTVRRTTTNTPSALETISRNTEGHLCHFDYISYIMVGLLQSRLYAGSRRAQSVGRAGWVFQKRSLNKWCARQST